MSINEIIGKMTIDEKIRFLNGKNNAETLDFPEYGVESMFLADGPCGLRKQDGETGDFLGIGNSVPATATVSGGLLAATWSEECARQNGQILGEECALEGVDLLLAPAINLVRSPLCGRNYEYMSEDPFLTGKIAAGYVNGVQGAGVGACLKHFAANNQETEREFINEVIDERTLRETYLPCFEIPTKEAAPMSVMTALSMINSTFGAENKWLIEDILRQEWGYEGFTVSDWLGVVHPDLAVKAGLDLNMPHSDWDSDKLKAAYEAGKVSEEEIDQCVYRLMKAVFAAAERRKARKPLDKEQTLRAHHEMTAKIAEEGIVLLRNEENILPLSTGDKVAVIGYHAYEPKITLAGSARVIKTDMERPLDWMKKYGEANITYAQGYHEDDHVDESLVQEAVRLASSAEKVVYFMGQAPSAEHEGHDRKHLDMPASQEALLTELLKVNANLIVVLFNASAVTMPWRDRVKGIFECFIAGQASGKAIANLLYGKVNPSGKLPVSMTKCLEDTSAYLFFPGTKREVAYHEGVFVGYKYYDLKHTDLLYPFGHGLSYTNFEYYDMKLSCGTLAKGENEVEISLKVKNTGTYIGKEVVQLYVGMFDTYIKRPKKELKGFAKVELYPGEEKLVTLRLSRQDFAYYDVNHHEWYAPTGDYQIMLGSSSADIRLTASLHLEAEKEYMREVSGWSTVEELRKSPKGEEAFQYLKRISLEAVKGESRFFSKDILDDDEKAKAINLRMFNVLTGGKVDTYQLMELLEPVNRERRHM